MRQEDIEKAAKEYANNRYDASDIKWHDRTTLNDVANRGYIAGANWALEHQWISVKEALPEDRKEVLVYDQDGSMVYTAWYNHIRDKWIPNRFGKLSDESILVDESVIDITHWMPIPKLLKEEE